jgi:hypothetical protein
LELAQDLEVWLEATLDEFVLEEHTTIDKVVTFLRQQSVEPFSRSTSREKAA